MSRAYGVFLFFFALLNSVNNQLINTFFLTVFGDNLTFKQRPGWRKLHSNQSATAGSQQLLQATLVTKDVAKEDLEEDNQPNYSEIAYQLLQDNVQAAVNNITSS